MTTDRLYLVGWPSQSFIKFDRDIRRWTVKNRLRTEPAVGNCYTTRSAKKTGLSYKNMTKTRLFYKEAGFVFANL